MSITQWLLCAPVPIPALTLALLGAVTPPPLLMLSFFAAFEILVKLCYTEVQMQHHPGFYYYPSLHDNGRVRFPLVDPESDSVASHLARYITASYLMIHELA